MFKKEKVVMLSTNEKAENCLVKYYNGKMGFSKELLTESYRKAAHLICYHLYVISNDEKPKIGDWFIINDVVHKCIEINKVSGDIESNNGLCYDKTKCKKIIVATDSSLKIADFPELKNTAYRNLPKFSQSFIEKYIECYNKGIECYNKGEMITDVLVEYEECSAYEVGLFSNRQWKLKINHKDNTITIKKIKNNWDREELKKLFDSYGDNSPAKIIWEDINNL